MQTQGHTCKHMDTHVNTCKQRDTHVNTDMQTRKHNYGATRHTGVICWTYVVPATIMCRTVTQVICRTLLVPSEPLPALRRCVAVTVVPGVIVIVIVNRNLNPLIDSNIYPSRCPPARCVAVVVVKSAASTPP